MKKCFTLLVLIVLVLQSSSFAQQEKDNTIPIEYSPVFTILPPEYAAIGGTGVFTGPLGSTTRIYQFLIHDTLLVSLRGKQILSFALRLPVAATANWPTAEIVFPSYEVRLSGSVAPADRSLTFANNIVGSQVLVRQGPLTVAANAYRFGSTPNEFGPPINFDTPYDYANGHLLIELRHTGFTGTSRSNDAITTSTTGYGTLFSACWASSLTATSGSQGNFSVLQLVTDDPIPVELTSLNASVDGGTVTLQWSTATETNNSGFEIERKGDDGTFKRIGFVAGKGTVTTQNSYIYNDSPEKPGIYEYRLKQVDFNGTFEYSDVLTVNVTVPTDYALYQNYPNPFNPSTTVRFALKAESQVVMKVFNALGQEVRTLADKRMPAGLHEISFDATGLHSGLYMYRLEAKGIDGSLFTSIRKMTLLK